MELENKVSIITGAASGIGAATARAFAKQGARVVVADRNTEGATAVASEIGGLTVPCDVGQEADINRLVARTQDEYGPVDVFFSNAGIATATKMNQNYRLSDRFGLRFQSVDATQALNRSAGDSYSDVFLGRSLSRRATALSFACECYARSGS